LGSSMFGMSIAETITPISICNCDINTARDLVTYVNLEWRTHVHDVMREQGKTVRQLCKSIGGYSMPG